MKRRRIYPKVLAIDKLRDLVNQRLLKQSFNKKSSHWGGEAHSMEAIYFHFTVLYNFTYFSAKTFGRKQDSLFAKSIRLPPL